MYRHATVFTDLTDQRRRELDMAIQRPGHPNRPDNFVAHDGDAAHQHPPQWQRSRASDGAWLQVASVPSLLAGADEWFDPDRIDPDARWEVTLPDVADADFVYPTSRFLRIGSTTFFAAYLANPNRHRLFYSEDNGRTWAIATDVATGQPLDVSGIASDSIDEGFHNARHGERRSGGHRVESVGAQLVRDGRLDGRPLDTCRSTGAALGRARAAGGESAARGSLEWIPFRKGMRRPEGGPQERARSSP